ncbi:MAG: LapA family protein [Deltaproteobacteria bacterium]|nr:LapA family protein [Deltaproteobacteria bacterium]
MSRRNIFALLLSLLALIFALQNTDTIDLHFLWWDFPMKVGFAVGVPFIAGVFVGWLSSWRQQKKLQKLQHQPEPGSPAALLASTQATTGKKKASWWW